MLLIFNLIFLNCYSFQQVLNKTGQLFGCFEFNLEKYTKKDFWKLQTNFTTIDFGEKTSRKKCIQYCSERFIKLLLVKLALKFQVDIISSKLLHKH